MRELVFTLDYASGENAVADALAAHPEARIRSLSLHATAERLWRVDHATGPDDALTAVEAAFRGADYYADCLATEDCGATQRTQVVERSPETLVLYSDWERTPACASVPHIALDHLGAGVLFDTRHEGRQYTWRLIHSGEGDVSAFFDALDAAVGDCAEMAMRRVRDAGDDGGLPPAQREALRAAVDHGYYETPRETDAAELADVLGVPRSTLTYRLRRAEAHLATGHVAEERPDAVL
ncbi:MAG: helix-turn-helix domain-containing protein [Halobacteriaceae archaeon]